MLRCAAGAQPQCKQSGAKAPLFSGEEVVGATAPRLIVGALKGGDAAR